MFKTRKDKMPKRTLPQKTVTVGFRMGQDHLALLEQGAAAYGMSVHEYARRLVIGVLEDTERERIRDEVKRVGTEVQKLRRDVATSLETLLLNLTKATDEEIRQWVSEHLRR
jgi:hypothetical protein